MRKFQESVKIAVEFLSPVLGFFMVSWIVSRYMKAFDVYDEGGLVSIMLLENGLFLFGLVFGLMKRRYFFFGLLLSAMCALVVRFGFSEFYLVDSSTVISKLVLIFLFLAAALPGWLIGWLMRIGGELLYGKYHSNNHSAESFKS